MTNTFVRYKDDLSRLLKEGDKLLQALEYQYDQKEFRKRFPELSDEEFNKYLDNLPDFRKEYQMWYTESLSIITLLIPDRAVDFSGLYDKNQRREIQYKNRIAIDDYLITTNFFLHTDEKEVLEVAKAKFAQQLYILNSTVRKFESSLFDIKHLLQADLFDTELDAANELNNKGFMRGAGAIAGVVLEKHLRQVCENHRLTTRKKKPAISDFNDMLKNNDVLDIPDWRFIQHLTDLRNLCDHDKKREPTKEEVHELIIGVDRIIKSIF